MIRSFAILGTGAVGGYHGALLARAGHEVHFLARSDADHIRAHGLRIVSGGDELTLDVPVHRDADTMPRCDVTIVAVKATSNHAISQAIAAVMKPDGVVLVLQNGLDVERDVAPVVTSALLAGGVPYVAARRTSPGVIQHIGHGLIELGVWSADSRSKVAGALLEDVAEDLRRSGVPVNVVEDLAGARWRKLVWNIAFGGLCVVLDCDSRAITDQPDRLARVRALMEEVVTCARVCGHAIELGWVDQMIDETIELPALPSIKVDFDAGAPIEVEAIFGNPLRAAKRAGYSAPALNQLYEELVAMDIRRG